MVNGYALPWVSTPETKWVHVEQHSQKEHFDFQKEIEDRSLKAIASINGELSFAPLST